MTDLAPRGRDLGAYVVRSIEATPDGRVVYTVVNLAGRVLQVTIPRHLTLSEDADSILRRHVTEHALDCERR